MMCLAPTVIQNEKDLKILKSEVIKVEKSKMINLKTFVKNIEFSKTFLVL